MIGLNLYHKCLQEYFLCNDKEKKRNSSIEIEYCAKLVRIQHVISRRQDETTEIEHKKAFDVIISKISEQNIKHN